MNNSELDHVRLVASLTDADRVNLTSKSDFQGLVFLLSHVITILVTASWIALGVTGWQLIMLIHGIQLVFLFTLLHETVHDTPFASLWLNRVIGWGCGLIIFLPPLWFRYYHLAHHRYTHNPDKDPELAGRKIETIWDYLRVLTGISVWWFHLKTISGNALGRVEYTYLPKSAARRVVVEARIMLLVYALILGVSAWFSSIALVFLWLLPMLLGQPFLRLYLMAEHGRCPHVSNMLENSRTTYTTRMVRWLAWNMPYHAEHHSWPVVPFHKLPEFHNVTREHLRVTSNGYVSFHGEMVSSLRD